MSRRNIIFASLVAFGFVLCRYVQHTMTMIQFPRCLLMAASCFSKTTSRVTKNLELRNYARECHFCLFRSTFSKRNSEQFEKV